MEDEGNYPERALYHFARIYSSSLPAGDDYSLLSRTIIISIIDFELFDCEEIHSEFQVLEVKRHTPLTDKCGLHFFELPKMPNVGAINTDDEKDLWLALFNAETEEELDELLKNGGAVIGEAIQAYRGVTATEEFRNLEWLRAKTRHDEAQALGNARRKERELWQSVVAEKDTENADLRAHVAEKDAENADLRAQLETLRTKIKKD